MEGVVNPLERPLTVGAILASAALSVWWWMGNDVSRLFMDDSAVGAEPWRLLTSTLLHADFIHLAFNGLWMFRFGMLLESRFGPARFALLFAVLAAGSGAAERAIFGGGVGLSGVVYGFFGFLWAARRSGQSYAEEAADQRTTALFVGWFLFCIAATYTDVMAIANVAHGMGGILGAVIGFAASRPKARIAASVGAGVLVAASLAGAGPLRSKVNFAGEAKTPRSATLADEAIDAGNHEEAVTHYLAALDQTPDDWRLWYNLSVAYDRLGRFEEAIDAAKKAHTIEATEKTRRGLGVAYGRHGNHLIAQERFEDALEAYRQAEAIAPDTPGYKINLSICLTHLGRHDEAQQKRAEAEALEADAGAE